MIENNRIKILEQEVKSLKDSVNYLSEKFWELYTDYYDRFENDKIKKEESYENFMNDVLIKNDSQIISDNELYDEYKRYFNDNYPKISIDRINTIISKFTEILGSNNRIKRGFINWTFNNYRCVPEKEGIL